MKSDPYTIRIFVPDGDPEGVRIIDRMNWTGVGIAFPRSKWADTKRRPEFTRPGVYFLVGYREEDELPALYIGQTDTLVDRFDLHIKQKDFWDWAIVFVSGSGGLNRAHVTWLEYALVERAKRAQRCHLENGNSPQEPSLTEAEKADCQAFLKEMLPILPLMNIHALEEAKPVATPKADSADMQAAAKSSGHALDTIVVPAQEEGFKRVFLGENAWHAIRIGGGKLDKIKFIAAYQTAPVSAVTHVAPVKSIEPYGDSGKYKLIFSEKAKAITPIPFKDAPTGLMQGPRYTSFDKLQKAKKVAELFEG